MDYYKKYQSQEWVDIQNEHANEFKENNNFKIKTMKETIKQIKDLATATDNLYLLHLVNKLEKQINN